MHGGVPICWPWFGRKSDDLPMHGLARYAQWTVTGTDGANVLRLRLDSSEATRRIWPYDFSLTCTVFLLETNRIEVSCSDNEDWFVWNPGAEVTAKCRTLDADDWRRFYCLEPCTLTPRVLKPGESRTHRLRLAVRARPEPAPCQSGPTSSRKLTQLYAQ